MEDELSQPPPDGWTYRDVLYCVLLAIPAYLLAAVLCTAGFFLSGLLPTGRIFAYPPLVVAVQLVWWALLLGFLYARISITYRLPFGPAIGWRRFERSSMAYLLWGALLAVGVVLIGNWLPTPTGNIPIHELAQDRASLIVFAVFGISLGPVTEELFLRGFLFAVIERVHGSLAAVMATGVIFGLMHGWGYGWHWQGLVSISCVAFAFGAVRARTQSVIPPTLMHMGYNATLFAGVLVAGDHVPAT